MLYSIASAAVLVPYLFSALYSLKLTITRETYTIRDNKIRKRDMFISIISVIYAIWLMYAAGLKYILLLSILFSVGIFVFYKAKKEKNTIVFTKIENIIAVILIIVGVITFCMMITGKLII